jgi:hypothetical protein
LLLTVILALSAVLSIGALVIAVQSMLLAVGWSPAAVGICIASFEALVLLVGAYLKPMPRGRRRYPFAFILPMLAIASLFFLPLGHSVGTAGNSVSQRWVLTQLGAHFAVPVFFVLVAGATARGWIAAHESGGVGWSLLRPGIVATVVGLVVLVLRLGAVDLSNLRLAWTVGFVALIVLANAVEFGPWRLGEPAESPRVDALPPLPVRHRLEIALLALAPSALLIGVITYATRLVPAAPIVWGVPLLLYLLSWLVAATPAVRRFLHGPAFVTLPFTAIAVVLTLTVQPNWPVWGLLVPQAVNLLVASLVCHDEIARRREVEGNLGEISLLVVAGAAAGGILTVFIAPLVFATFAEYPWAVAIACFARRAPEKDEHAEFSPSLDLGIPIAMGVVLFGVSRALNRWAIAYSSGDVDVIRILVFGLGALLALTVRRWPVRFGLAIAAVLLVASLPLGEQPPTLFAARSFFAADSVVAHTVPGDHTLLADGTVLGIQNTGKDPSQILTYDSRSGPAGQVFATPAAKDAKNVTVLGVRTGALACYGTANQNYSFYERDPEIEHTAQDPSLFTFVRDCPPTSVVIPGVERDELSRAPAHTLGLIVVQAGNGPQSDPSLYTEEAMRLYTSKLATGGVLAFDITLGAVDLHQPVADAAAASGLTCFARDDLDPSVDRLLAGVYPSSWVACALSSADLGGITSDPRWHQLAGTASSAWTDDRVDLIRGLDLGPNA